MSERIHRELSCETNPPWRDITTLTLALYKDIETDGQWNAYELNDWVLDQPDVFPQERGNFPHLFSGDLRNNLWREIFYLIGDEDGNNAHKRFRQELAFFDLTLLFNQIALTHDQIDAKNACKLLRLLCESNIRAVKDDLRIRPSVESVEAFRRIKLVYQANPEVQIHADEALAMVAINFPGL